MPTCPVGIEDCAESSNTTIVPRRVPRPPIVDVPMSIGTSSRNSFTSSSLLVSMAMTKAPPIKSPYFVFWVMMNVEYE